MLAFLGSILSALGIVAKNVWSFAKAKLLLAWATAKLLTPTIIFAWLKYRLVQLGMILGVCYILQRTILDALRVISSGIVAGLSLSSVLGQFGWAGWLVWDGPLQFGQLWDEILSCFTYWVTLRLASFSITRVEWFESTFLRTMGRRLGGD